MLYFSDIPEHGRSRVVIICSQVVDLVKCALIVRPENNVAENYVSVLIPYSHALGVDRMGRRSYYDETHQMSYALKKSDVVEDGLELVEPVFDLIDDELAELIEYGFTKEDTS